MAGFDSDTATEGASAALYAQATLNRNYFSLPTTTWSIGLRANRAEEQVQEEPEKEEAWGHDINSIHRLWFWGQVRGQQQLARQEQQQEQLPHQEQQEQQQQQLARSRTTARRACQRQQLPPPPVLTLLPSNPAPPAPPAPPAAGATRSAGGAAATRARSRACCHASRSPPLLNRSTYVRPFASPGFFFLVVRTSSVVAPASPRAAATPGLTPAPPERGSAPPRGERDDLD
mgnify:CR=1 FL=1